MSEAKKLNVVCTQENLQKGLQTVTRVVSSSSTLPILNNVLMKTENGQLKISSTNLEIAISTTVRCKVESEGELCAPAKTLADLIMSLPNQNITLEQKENELSVRTEHYFSSIKTLPSEEFPLIPSIDNPKTITIDAQELKKSLDRVVFAAATSETQPEISGVFFSADQKKGKLVATDRYRLSEQVLPFSSTQNLKGVIIPQRAVLELGRVIGTQKGKVELAFSESQVAITFNETYLVSRLIDGQYPDYRQIVPASFSTTIIADKMELSGALKTSGIFSRSSNSVKLFYSAKEGKLKISSTSQDVGESMVELESEITGSTEEGEVIFNHRYILDALNTMDKKKVVIKIVNDSSPVILQPEGDDNFMYLVMPIKS